MFGNSPVTWLVFNLAPFVINPYAAPPLLTAVAVLVLGLAAMAHEQRPRISGRFLHITLAVAGFLFAIAGHYGTVDPV